MIQINAAARLQLVTAAPVPKWMLQMGTALGNMPKFSSRKADALIEAYPKGLEVEEDRAHAIVEAFKKAGYKILKLRSNEVKVVARAGNCGLQVKFGKGEEATLAFYDNETDDDEEVVGGRLMASKADENKARKYLESLGVKPDGVRKSVGGTVAFDIDSAPLTVKAVGKSLGLKPEVNKLSSGSTVWSFEVDSKRLVNVVLDSAKTATVMLISF